MSKISSNINESAKRYAKALILSSENKDPVIKNFRNDFDKLVTSYQEVEVFREFIMTPLINKNKKKEALIKILIKMNLSQEFINFFKIVANHGKLYLLEKIYNEFKKSLDEKEGITEVTVTTTLPLEKQFEENIVKNIGSKLKKKIRLNKLVDPELIGGIVIKIDSIMIDNSIKTKLLDYNLNERLG
ncbi:MAG: ATP synthase F1 subunit delta [Alphaproteobacteria bacterium]|nr:ATP synthase F1 subunit delta [Alphaproteobacteria bacterium]